MEKGLLAAIRHFPLKSQEIRRRALADTNFRSLCDDLADAEAALDRWAHSPMPQSGARRAEYEILVTELVNEIECLLDVCDENVEGDSSGEKLQ